MAVSHSCGSEALSVSDGVCETKDYVAGELDASRQRGRFVLLSRVSTVEYESKKKKFNKHGGYFGRTYPEQDFAKVDFREELVLHERELEGDREGRVHAELNGSLRARREVDARRLLRRIRKRKRKLEYRRKEPHTATFSSVRELDWSRGIRYGKSHRFGFSVYRSLQRVLI
jgi:hypothetical protein